MNKTKRNIIISKAGGNSSGVNYKISLPAKMVKALGITEEDRTVILELLTTPVYQVEHGWRKELCILISKGEIQYDGDYYFSNRFHNL